MDRTDIQNAVFPAPDRFCFCGAAADAEAFRVPELFLFFLFLQKLLYFPQLHFVFFLSGKFPVFLPELRGSDSVLFKKYPVLPVNLFLKLPKCLQWTYRWYGVLYASRTVIKNGNIKPRVHNHYYGTDVWAEYYELLKDFIPKGYTIYGEILGYCGGSNTMVQKNYDYKCKPGENKLMIYRVVRKRLFRKKVEFDVMDVEEFTLELQEKLRKKLGNAAAERIHPIDILYNGTMRDLYPDIPVDTHWHENVLAAMKSDPRFAIEDDEPMCRTKVPREGIVLRINGDPAVGQKPELPAVLGEHRAGFPDAAD